MVKTEFSRNVQNIMSTECIILSQCRIYLKTGRWFLRRRCPATSNRSARARIIELQDISRSHLHLNLQVLVMDRHVLFLTLDGRVLACGAAANGVLGLGVTEEAVSQPTLLYFPCPISQIYGSNEHSFLIIGR